MAHAHDFSVVGLGRDVQAIGQSIALDGQRVVAGYRKGRGQAFEHIGARMRDVGHLAMHDLLGSHNVAAEGGAYGLVSKAYAQYVQLAGKVLYQFYGNACVGWRARLSEEHTSELQLLLRISSAVFSFHKMYI